VVYRTTRERTDLDRLLEKLAFVQEGVVSLLGTVDSKINEAAGSSSAAALALTVPRSTTAAVFPTSSPTTPRRDGSGVVTEDTELVAQPIIFPSIGGGSLTDVAGGRAADLRIQVEVDPPVSKLEARLVALVCTHQPSFTLSFRS
jgi:hypothetical protein